MAGLDRWLDLIESQIGFVLPKAQHLWLKNALQTQAVQENLTLDALYQAALARPAVRQSIYNRITILQSRFFRDAVALDWLSDKLKSQGAPKIASIGCSTGQEAYSLFLQMPQSQIVGLDVNTQALSVARGGRYPMSALSQIPAQYHTQVRQEAGEFIIDAQDRMRFLYYNVFDKTPPDIPMMDAILCQNMLIYFRKFDQRDILERLSTRLKVGGYLVLAPSEGYDWQPNTMQKQASINAWQKIKKDDYD